MGFKEVAIKAAKETGKILLDNFEKVKEIKQKGINDYVTNVDIKCEKKIMSIIKQKYPNHSFLCEESGQTKKSSEYEWVIDPLDGTHNYMHSFPMFGTSIALKKNKETILGVIYIPLLKKMYIAQKGKGAFVNGKKINVSKNKKLINAFVLFDSNIHRLPDLKFKFLQSLSRKVFSVRMIGCSVVNGTQVAVGHVEGYIAFSPKEWDIAAAHLMIKEAGGIVSKTKIGKDVLVLSGNKEIVSALLNKFKSVLKK
jgi:myo-inositol-1(or 4)-monophosphatase